MFEIKKNELVIMYMHKNLHNCKFIIYSKFTKIKTLVFAQFFLPHFCVLFFASFLGGIFKQIQYMQIR